MVPPLTLCSYMKKGPNLRWSLIQCSGGDEGNRTPDLLTASQALSQLSYAPVRRSTIRELGRRCKDNFGKTFCGAARVRPIGPESPEKARGARPAGGGHAAARVVWVLRPPRGPPARRPCALTGPFDRPRDLPPRNRPIYYVWASSPDHADMAEMKTAGRRPAVFAEYGVWSRGRGKT